MVIAKIRNDTAGQTDLVQFYMSARVYQGMPMVRTTDEYLVPWDRNMISGQLIRETQRAPPVP